PLAKHISETKEMTLSYNQSVFSFEFAALNFISPEKNQYAYKLEGFDKDWTYSGSKWTATYTNLDPGKYIFKVKGSNNDGVWNEQGTSLKIIITPPFWQTWWFRVAGSIALLALIVTVHRIRTVAIRERNKQLEEINTRLNKQIAARQRVEELVRTQKEYFEALFNSAPEAIASLDMNQHIVTVNPQFEALFGYSLDEIKGKHIDELIVPRDKLAESEEITTRVLQGDVAKIESIRRRKDGSLVHVTVGGAPVVVEGKQVGVYAVYVDITERKLLEGKLKEHSEQLEKINSKLRREMTEKEDFLRAVSHDLGAPLRNIAGMAASLIRKYGPCLNQEVKHRLERIQSNAVKEMQLIQELLELSRIKTQREKFEAVNLQTLIQNIKEMFEYQLEERAITLTLHNPLPTIYCEKNRIKQVFQNLIDNAIKYMGNEEHPQIEIGSDEENSRFIFWVKDNGIGIKKENQQRIFHIFRRGEGQAVAKVEGKGIGLATVKSIVENYDGEIWVESEEGKGSTFYFTLSKEIVTPKLEVIKDGP
ncbi:MAG: ATP-binding protein, partial [candidate division KSB1 bacterium]|nr:ATP-binding protein [candidate division KSB1 bacterium]